MYRFEAAPAFWRSYRKLTLAEQHAAKRAWQIFKLNPFDPGYLYYTLGKLEFLKLRKDYQRQEGAAFSLQKFHDEVLRHGAPPIRLLREILLRDRATWDEIF